MFILKEMVHYGLSKAAQLVVAQGAAEQTKGTKITVNSVLPGPARVEMQTERLAARAASRGPQGAHLHRATAGLAAAALRHPDEIANMICYVCSRASSAANGAALRVEGGIVTNPF